MKVILSRIQLSKRYMSRRNHQHYDLVIVTKWKFENSFVSLKEAKNNDFMV